MVRRQGYQADRSVGVIAEKQHGIECLASCEGYTLANSWGDCRG